MSLSCRPIIGTFTYDAACGCTLVDFDFTIKDLCNNSKYAVVLGVFYGEDIVATVCDIFDVDDKCSRPCSCVDVTRHFRGIITDVDCCNADISDWDVRPLHANYIYGCRR